MHKWTNLYGFPRRYPLFFENPEKAIIIFRENQVTDSNMLIYSLREILVFTNRSFFGSVYFH